MARIRPTELKAVIELLDQPADNVASLAENVIRKIDELRAARNDWYVVQLLADKQPILWGPYTTADAARKDIGNTIVAVSKGGDSGWIVPIKRGDE